MQIKLKERDSFNQNEKDLIKKMQQMELEERDEIIKKQQT